ncbi:hypothetical protein AB4Z48_14980 [Cupriavidus sp. 2TAF22]|uniref:hypothetical protein n=1 Tax=unclassified Cupriavidus TaxID=2640874 RepID=UPI003F8FE44B
MQGIRVTHDSPSRRRDGSTRAALLLAGAVLAVLLGVVAPFWAQVDAHAVLHEWKHLDSGLSMILLGALVLGPVLAFGLDA